MSLTTPTDAENAAAQRRWYQRPATVLGLLGAAALVVVLWQLGTRDLSYNYETLPSADTPFDVSWAGELAPLMLNALSVTALATVLGFAIAAVLGLFLALGRRSTRKLVSWPFAFLIEFIRSTPLLVQLFFLYFALPELGIVLDPLQALVFGLGVHYATYCSEAYRAGINSVPKGQWEASTALNLGRATTWRQVVLPQAIPNVLPALGNFLVAAFKDAPLGSAINVPGVLFFATTITSRSFRSVEPFMLIGVGFLMVSLPAAWLVRRLEGRLGYERI